jgi:hypothetical protein
MRPSPSPAPRRRCTASRNDGRACRAWAVRGSQPPRCAVHAGRGGGHADPGGCDLALVVVEPAGGQAVEQWSDRGRLGLWAPPRDLTRIEQVIADLAERQAMLTEYIAAQVAEGADIGDVARLFALHGQNASRLGRLLRDQQALSGDSADGLLDAIGTALDELSAELGIKL